MKGLGSTIIVALLVIGAGARPVGAQTRQSQVTAERARTEASDLKACPLLTIAEIRQVTGRTQPLDLDDEVYDMGSACDYGGGVVTIRVFGGNRPEDEIDWTLKNYGKEDEQRLPVEGFGRGAFLLFPAPRTPYEDTVALLIGRAGPRMFMISLTAPDGQSAASVRPQLAELAKRAMARLQ